MTAKNLKVLIIASEIAPLAKTGGLADVTGSLPRELALLENRSACEVRLAMPHYRSAPNGDYLADFPVPLNNRLETCIVRQTYIKALQPYNTKDASKNEPLETQHRQADIPVYLIANYHFFGRNGLYGYTDEAERFFFFCLAVLEMLPRLGWKPDIIHCNDWQTGPVPFLLKTRFGTGSFFAGTATVFTIHNLLYQGNFSREILHSLELDEKYYNPGQLEFYGTVSFMKMGIVFADKLSTVSKSYAKEIQQPWHGELMDGCLRERSGDLYGIVNGIDYNVYNPATDPYIHSSYDHLSFEHKIFNKTDLQREMGLPQKNVPVIGIVSRLVEQKGLDLIAEIASQLFSNNVQLVILGNGDRHYEEIFRKLQNSHGYNTAFFRGFNEALASKIYAGSDMLLIPSIFEPCGLSQLIAMRYGTVPVVRATGGLADTVQDYSPENGCGNGFVFKEYNGSSLYHAIIRALSLYIESPKKWRELARHCMDMDFSWRQPAKEYLEVYHKAAYGLAY
jgi:starch synthase